MPKYLATSYDLDVFVSVGETVDLGQMMFL